MYKDLTKEIKNLNNEVSALHVRADITAEIIKNGLKKVHLPLIKLIHRKSILYFILEIILEKGI
jgi:hypothetical protein